MGQQLIDITLNVNYQSISEALLFYKVKAYFYLNKVRKLIKLWIEGKSQTCHNIHFSLYNTLKKAHMTFAALTPSMILLSTIKLGHPL